MQNLTRAIAVLSLAAATLPGCAAAELDANAYFSKTYATDYALITDCDKSGSHGGKYVKTYVTKSSEADWKAKKYPFAESTVFVKVMHNDSKCSDISGYSAMKKIAAGSGGAAGDWNWQNLDADGQVTAAGQIGSCTGCHSGYQANDYVGTLP